MVNYYALEIKIGWKWQSVDSKMVPAPLGGAKTSNKSDGSRQIGRKNSSFGG